MILEKSVPGIDEDTVTISVEAARSAIKRAEIDPQKIGAIYFPIYINTPESVCKKWNIARGSPIPTNLIHEIFLNPQNNAPTVYIQSQKHLLIFLYLSLFC